MHKIGTKIMILFLAILVTIPGIETFAREFTVTPGVEYKKGVSKWNNRAQSIHTIEVDVGRSDVSVEALIPNPIKNLNPLTTILSRASSEGHQVVAGINASFFHTTGMHAKSPAYLLAADNKINTYGVISTGNHEYMSVPSAFGIDQYGKGQIGTFGYEATVITPSGTQKITTINKARGNSEVILYTPSYSYESTRSNEVGMEIVLTNLSSSIEENYHLGTSVTAKVDKVVEYQKGGNSKIPKDGAVISIQGGAQAAEFGKIQAGDELTLSVDLTNPWQNADFVLASGPLLVQNGKVDMTINPSSSRANTRHPRTAVAVNQDGTKVFLVTVDGRATNSAGMTLTEFSNYLVSLGAYGALNLDGGGSTTMAVRERGQQDPTVFNAPSDKFQRYVSAVLGAVSYTNTGQANILEAQLTNPSTMSIGATTAVNVTSALDVNFHVVPIQKSDITYSTTGNIGTISSTGLFTATKEGKGSIVVNYGNATKSFPIEVVNEPLKLTIVGANKEVGPGESIQLEVKAVDSAGRETTISSSLLEWSATSELGTISTSGVLKSNSSGSGTVTAKFASQSVSMPIRILNGGRVLHSFEQSTEWKASSARSLTTLRFDGAKSPLRDGNTGLTLSYDFTQYPTGTSASYAVAQKPIAIAAKPTALGLWVFGDGASHWLRGTITDRTGKDFVVDFTKESGLTWTGWKYVKAQLPAAIQGPISLKQIYIAETSSDKKNKGSIYLDRLVAEYGDSHKEQLFSDVPLDYWALAEISNAVDHGWINGYTNGTFKPANNLTRAHAAVLLSRALNLPTNLPLADFNDVQKDHIYAKEIAAVNRAGIMTGKDGNQRFDPNGSLTRAQMAKMLVKAYSLTRGDQAVPELTDVNNTFWAYDDIQILQANQITVVSDYKYRPNESVTRAQFAAFMTRAQK